MAEVPTVIEVALVHAIAGPTGDAARLVVIGVSRYEDAALVDGNETVVGVPGERTIASAREIAVGIVGEGERAVAFNPHILVQRVGLVGKRCLGAGDRNFAIADLVEDECVIGIHRGRSPRAGEAAGVGVEAKDNR